MGEAAPSLIKRYVYPSYFPLMTRGRRRERRAGYSFFKLRRSHFMKMSPLIAIPLLLLALGLTALGDALAPPTLWFGPVYLLVIGCAAWMLGRRRAMALGLLIIVGNLITGNTGEFPYGPSSTFLNFTIRATAVIGIVLLLGTARSALEKEWTLARTDHLTEALNRQAFFEVVGSRDTSPCWSVLVYADLDGLKHINDSMGHKHGDCSIIAFAQRVRSAIRKEDLFARMGGDEFVILMNVRDEQAGIGVAERLNRSLNVDAYHDEKTTLLCSLGVLILPPGPRTIDMELKAADMLMYEAKRLKIGLLVATAKMTSQAIALSRHISNVPPANRSTAIRSYTRGLEVGIETVGIPPIGEPEALKLVATNDLDQIAASQRRR